LDSCCWQQLQQVQEKQESSCSEQLISSAALVTRNSFGQLLLATAGELSCGPEQQVLQIELAAVMNSSQ